jgi:LCP family protein required for cell wall assembly
MSPGRFRRDDAGPKHRSTDGARWHAVRVAGRVFFAALSVGLLLLAGYVWSTFRDINGGVTRLGVHVNAPPSGRNDIDGEDQNLLLVGNDDRSNMTDAEVRKLKVGRDGGSLNTDTMMIVHVPADGSKATLISLPRDTWVDIPGHGWNRLNAAYGFGYNAAGGTPNSRRTAGADLLIRTITDLTGLTINHYVQVSLIGFYDLANAIGGITVNLCHAVDDTVAHNRSIGSDGGSGFKMPAGRHHLNAVQSLEFVRQRHNFPRGDLDRVKRQQYFLTAAFRKVASVGVLLKLRALGDAVKRNLYMDPGLNLLDLARQMENLSADNIIGRTIPTTPATIDGMDVLQVRPARVRAFIAKLAGPTVSPSTAASSATPASTAPSPAVGRPTASSSGSPTQPIDAKCIN